MSVPEFDEWFPSTELVPGYAVGPRRVIAPRIKRINTHMWVSVKWPAPEPTATKLDWFAELEPKR